MKYSNSLAKAIALSVGVLAMVVFITFISLAWTEPGSAPPAGNVSAPLNVGVSTQDKLGWLTFEGGGTRKDTYLATISGDVGIGTTGPGAKLDVQGGDIKVGGITIKADGTVSTGLNTEKVGGYTAADLMAAGGGAWVTASTYFTTGGEPYFCSKKTVDLNGFVTKTNINDGNSCSYSDLTSRCNGGNCVVGSSAFSFFDQTGVSVNSTISSNAVSLAGTFTNLTATCNPGCTNIAKNGVWAGTTILAGFNPNDTIAIKQIASSNTYTSTTATVTVGSTISGTWKVTTLASSNNVQTFTSSGTWTKPSGYGPGATALIQCWGGGGGGGGGDSGGCPGGGGGGGAGGGGKSSVLLSSLPASVGVTIGQGGAAGDYGESGSATAGGAGGDTTFSSLTANGGAGGWAGGAVCSARPGGAGGSSSGFTTVWNGNNGANGVLAYGGGWASGGSPTGSVASGGGAAATVTVAGGVVTSITLTAGGNGYSAVPWVSIVDDSTHDSGYGGGATATVTVAGGVVTSITLTAGGNGYSSSRIPFVLITNAGNGGLGGRPGSDYDSGWGHRGSNGNKGYCAITTIDGL